MIDALLAGLLAAASSPLWLDASVPTNWNRAAAPLPRVAQIDPEIAPGGRCASTIRPPQTHEDRVLANAGWRLFGPYQLYAGTALVFAQQHADGMCRPAGYQGFVFVNGRFAGTIAPAPMQPRTDGSANIPRLFGSRDLTIEYSRYRPEDPLCCASGTTNVTFHIDTRGSALTLTPVRSETDQLDNTPAPR